MIFILTISGIWLYWKKNEIYQENRVTKYQYNRAKKINEISKAVFVAMNSANSAKTREVLRYTYGKVPEWNPINYLDNVLLYDIHEQIRSILISLKNIVISIDPLRFNDKNVSVELVYTYLTNKDDQDTSDDQKFEWKLISSGDTSGNHRKVLDYMNNKKSFYDLLEYFGMQYVNNKYEYISSEDCELIRKVIESKGENKDYKDFSVRKYFLLDTKDIEYSKNGEIDGSIAATIINVRNDEPQKIFVKAILTINTYGEPIFTTENKFTNILRKNKRKKKEHFDILQKDKFGLSKDDYNDLFCNIILDSYKTLLTSELSQMYIRHALKKKKKCLFTGRNVQACQNIDFKLSADCDKCKNIKVC